MSGNFDKWTFLKLLQVILAVACLVFKRVTDDEASRLFLYLQKLSREWSLLNNITWDKVGASLADATYGGYVIITAALFIGRIAGEIPTHKRITELILLGVGALLFIILGSLEFASLDSVPENLIDNAAILGTLSLVTAALFLLDMGGPKARKPMKPPPVVKETRVTPEIVNMELEKTQLEVRSSNGTKEEVTKRYGRPRHFDIYGRDVGGDQSELPSKMEQQSPVWSRIRKGQYSKYNIITPIIPYPQMHLEGRPPSGPGDPGYVQYTAEHWGERPGHTPRQSPTPV